MVQLKVVELLLINYRNMLLPMSLMEITGLLKKNMLLKMSHLFIMVFHATIILLTVGIKKLNVKLKWKQSLKQLRFMLNGN